LTPGARGTALGHIASMIGDTVQTTEKSYGTWVESRQDPLDDAVRRVLLKRSAAAAAQESEAEKLLLQPALDVPR
jgi:hypothetical protein